MSSEYYNSLSKASQASLRGQGGPFTAEEGAKLERTDKMLNEKIALRRFDDGAKVVGKQTRDLMQWWDAANRVYAGRGRDRVEPMTVEM